jgi:hypothetical protein
VTGLRSFCEGGAKDWRHFDDNARERLRGVNHFSRQVIPAKGEKPLYNAAELTIYATLPADLETESTNAPSAQATTGDRL